MIRMKVWTPILSVLDAGREPKMKNLVSSLSVKISDLEKIVVGLKTNITEIKETAEVEQSANLEDVKAQAGTEGRKWETNK